MATGTYNPNDLSTDLNRVRFLSGDVGPTTFHLTDAEITWVLAEESNIYFAAAEVADQVAGILGGGTSVRSRSVGDLSISTNAGDTRATEFARRSRALIDRGLRHSAPSPVSTAKSKAAKETREADDDLNRSGFAIGMHDNATGSGASRITSFPD